MNDDAQYLKSSVRSFGQTIFSGSFIGLKIMDYRDFLFAVHSCKRKAGRANQLSGTTDDTSWLNLASKDSLYLMRHSLIALAPL